MTLSAFDTYMNEKIPIIDYHTVCYKNLVKYNIYFLNCILVFRKLGIYFGHPIVCFTCNNRYINNNKHMLKNFKDFIFSLLPSQASQRKSLAFKRKLLNIYNFVKLDLTKGNLEYL